MTLVELVNNCSYGAPAGLNAVLCGSFRKDRQGLERSFADLKSSFIVLSPRSLDFVDHTSDFVRLPDEVGQDEAIIEDRHLSAMSSADFVWLHCPDGYVGTSAAMELGHAHALGIPVFASELPSDPVLASRVEKVSSPSDIDRDLLELLTRPGNGLGRLQTYYKATAERRGWDGESAQDTLLLITEELGELARAVRKNTGIARHQASPDISISEEVADVQLYLVHLANSLNLDLANAVTDKELVNAKRFVDRPQVV